ncbi:probable serine/threonine-protein kinase fhkB [Condylostylus longicornis]|uniref:probable serine/threonine-protein kinase fhkB n=1 Tax=Condylostylus longicornis TaxID=2530218 RepID=UPI00244DA3B8|nr:probable serine/threonine-protein kinase fhkB [Condylostylus longicornis]XP_055376807.1 probable serine/threonine-protein kinase fhkB [Condylostylus longicornis]
MESLESPGKFNIDVKKFYKIMRTKDILIFILLESLLLLSSVNGHREHKVHNITLYPDKHSWCNVLPIKQVISHPGCKSVEIDNNVCVGACFSYSIPHTEPSDPGEVIVPYCDSCQPSEKKLIHINLECDANNESDKKSQQLKVVQYITNCTCTSCEKDKYLEQILLGNSAKEIKELQNDAPDLLDALQNRDEINPKFFNLDPERSKLLKNLMNSQIMTLLKNIQSENSQKDKEQLTEALKIINEQSKEKVSDSTIAALVNSFYRENIELDLPKLLETLQALDNSKYFEKLRKNNNHHEGSGSEHNYNNNDDDENNDDISFNDGSHVGMGHLKGSHIGMGFTHHYTHHHQHQNHHSKKPSHHEYDTDNSSSNEDYDDRSDEHNEQHHHNDVEVENIPNKLDLNENSLLHKLHHKIHTHHMHHKHHHGNTGTIHHVGGDNTSGSIGSSTDSSAANEIEKPSSISSSSSSSSSVNNGGSNKDETIHQIHSKHHHHMHHQHGHHHLGEHLGHGHLTHGPHGSLVIEPDHIDHDDVEIQHSNGHERINVNPNDLKPNNAGTLLSYSSHPTSSNNS